MANKYLHLFKNQSEFETAYNGQDYEEPWVSFTEGNGVNYNKSDYTKIPFTIEALESGDISWNLGTKSIQYSKNGGEWATMTSATTISVVQGDEIQFKGTNNSYCVAGWGGSYSVVSSTASFNAKGNIMSLTGGDNFLTASTVSENAFMSFFESSPIISAEKLKLPAMTLAQDCYSSMFYDCISLTTAPKLPAETLAESCYYYMFAGCTSLTTAPELPATALTTSCYENMFDGCTSLTIAPRLPATTLTHYCYQYMFHNCTRLVTAPELPATALTTNCYYGMFSGCASLNHIKAMFTTTPSGLYTENWVNGVAANGTFVKNDEAGWNVSGNNGIPTGWIIETASS